MNTPFARGKDFFSRKQPNHLSRNTCFRVSLFQDKGIPIRTRAGEGGSPIDAGCDQFPPRAKEGKGAFDVGVILGPPGTGKTWYLLKMLDEELRRGIQVGRIIFLTFARAARREVLARVERKFRLGPDSCPWFRTIHSVAFRLLGLKCTQVMREKRWGEFGNRFGYEFSRLGKEHDSVDEGPFQPPCDTEDDQLLYVHEWGRNRRLDVEATLARCPLAGVRPEQFRLFVQRLEAFKAEHGLLDFPDFLEEVLRRGLRPDVDVGFVDEAQDLSPLEIGVVEMWLAPCVRSYVAGDDDQAIFIFKGADPEWLGRLASRTVPVILGQSYRVPAAVHALAHAIIRENVHRVPKAYKPTDEPGIVRQLDREEAMDLIDGRASTFVLARNRQYLRPYARGLMQRGVPYIVEGAGGPSPLSTPFLVQAVEIALRIQKGESVSLGDLDIFLRLTSPDQSFRPGDFKANGKDKHRKKSVFELCEPARFADLQSIRREMADVGPIGVLGKLGGETRAYVEAIIRQYGRIPEPHIRLTSIHGAKGREADLVVVDSSMSKATFKAYRGLTPEDREAENRVFYVAATRARKELVLVRSHTRRHFDFPRVDCGGGNSA